MMVGRQHLCGHMPAEGVYVYLAANFLEEDRHWRWCLYFERTATEKDLNTYHMLEQEGDTLWSAAIGISHCPFCGEGLPDDTLKEDRVAEMVMTDYRFDWLGR
ncbi:hypothetical protein [Halomonas cerina]|uniref:Uncharacterized protein n=1 Tax=Halomonas cerina TaxID=447424 RepID=A0A839V9E3_9GAMM|nr:hypothetical protein [Halomonas cerina]MBB3192263.1 hypothetical protein [Halomonas cerina]